MITEIITLGFPLRETQKMLSFVHMPLSQSPRTANRTYGVANQERNIFVMSQPAELYLNWQSFIPRRSQ